jgi:hypothetical protein
MKMAVLWGVAPCAMVEVYRLLDVLAASIIRTMIKPHGAEDGTRHL